MGELAFKGGASGKDFSIRETTPGEVEVTNESDGITLLRANATSIRDASGVQLSSHGHRHGQNGEDPIPDDGLGYRQIKVTFGSEQPITVDAGSTEVVPEGLYIVRLGPNTSVEYSPDGGATWYTLISAGGRGIVFSDGVNVRFNNTGTADEDSYLLPII